MTASSSGGELVGVDLVGQVEVPVDAVPDPDGGAEERRHGRVSGWEPDAGRMVADHGDPDGPGILDDHAEHALARSGAGPASSGPRRRAAARDMRNSTAGGALVVEHAERPVAGVGESERASPTMWLSRSPRSRLDSSSRVASSTLRSVDRVLDGVVDRLVSGLRRPVTGTKELRHRASPLPRPWSTSDVLNWR